MACLWGRRKENGVGYVVGLVSFSGRIIGLTRDGVVCGGERILDDAFKQDSIHTRLERDVVLGIFFICCLEAGRLPRRRFYSWNLGLLLPR
jgi:hypothetical protein